MLLLAAVLFFPTVSLIVELMCDLEMKEKKLSFQLILKKQRNLAVFYQSTKIQTITKS